MHIDIYCLKKMCMPILICKSNAEPEQKIWDIYNTKNKNDMLTTRKNVILLIHSLSFLIYTRIFHSWNSNFTQFCKVLFSPLGIFLCSWKILHF